MLSLAARHGRLVLVIGLAAGILLPGVALAMKPHIGTMVAGLLFLAALRVGPRQAVGAAADLGATAGLVLLFQVGFPLLAVTLFAAFGWHSAIAMGLLLMLAAPPVTGSPNLAIMSGGDPAPALRLLVIGTALLPLTVIPVFSFVPDLGSPDAVIGAAGGLMLLIAIAAGSAFLIRARFLGQPSEKARQAIDGLSALAMAVVVIGLMSAVGPALLSTPWLFARTLAVACAANFAIQIIVALVARRAGAHAPSAALGIAAGNRNMALFLTVLPQETLDPILLFLGCYQIPMYLTPALLGHFYRRAGNR